MPIEPVVVEPGADPLGEAWLDVQRYLVPPPSPDNRRTQRLRQAFVLGFHPVGNPYGRSVRLHPDAPHYDERTAPGPRCRDCLFRTMQPVSENLERPKCTATGHAWRPGRGMNILGWWPACIDYRPAPVTEPEAAPPAPPRSAATGRAPRTARAARQ